jgi:UDP-N-acetyl-D-glucosamine dehydrogenase
LGYVGLPLAIDLAEASYDVLAVDTSLARLDQLRSGESYVDDVASERLNAALSSGHLQLADTSVSCSSASVSFICVPTPVTASREPDLGAVLAAGKYVAAGLRKHDVVVLQSTTYPGTTMGPLRCALEETGLALGKDFGMAFSPERVSPGEGRPSSSIPRLVGGSDEETARRVAAILEFVAPAVTVMSSPDAAELSKLFENVFRNVNIALVNELALICERLNLDVWEVIAGASTKPFGFMPFYPGPGVGGHCIPVDPYYLAARAREVGIQERFIETAGDINSRMPEHVLQLIADALNERSKPVRGSSILVIGVAFKPDVSDARNSPAAGVIAGLQARGARVGYHDSRLPEFDPRAEGHGGERLCSIPLEDGLAADPDCVVIVTPHSDVDWDLVFGRSDLIVDTRNVSGGRQVRDRQVLRLGAGWRGREN